MATLSRVLARFQPSALPWRKWRVIDYVDSGDQIPDKLPYRGVVLVGTPNRPSWAALDCPCNTGHRLLLNLNEHRHPYWIVSSPRRASFWPSIDATVDSRRCHFVLNRGKIRWVRSP